MSKAKIIKELPEVADEILKKGPTFIDDFMRFLRGEASDATTKLGSGKNLEVLNKAKADIVEKARVSQAPAYPKNVVEPDILTNTPNRGVPVGKPQTTDFQMVPEGTALPALRTPTIPSTIDDVSKAVTKQTDDIVEATAKKADDVVEEAAEATAKQVDDVAQEAAETVTKQADNVAEEAAKNIDEVSKSSKITKGKVAAAVGGTAAAIAIANKIAEDKKNAQMGVEQALSSIKKPTQTVTPSEVASKATTEGMAKTTPEIKTDKVEEKPSEIKATESPVSEEDKQKIMQIGEKVSQSPETVTQDEINYLKILKDAQKSDDDARFINNLLRAGTTIGAAIAGVKPDYSGVEALEKQVNAVSKVKEQQAIEREQLKIKSEKNQLLIDQKKIEAAQKELDDDAKMSDPNSEVSKQMRQILVDMNYPVPENASAKTLKNVLGVNAYNLLAQKQQQNAQLEMEKLRQQGDLKIASVKAAQDEELSKLKVVKDNNQFITGAQKYLKKPFEEFQKLNSVFKSIEKFAASKPSGPKDVTLLYDFIKMLDPESAVRGGEITLSQQGMSLFEELGIKSRKLTSGELLSDTFRKGIVDIGREKLDRAKENYNQQANTIRFDAQVRGLTEDQMKRFDFMESIKADSTIPSKENATNPVKMVNVTNLATGQVKTLPASTVESYNLDPAKYKIEGR